MLLQAPAARLPPTARSKAAAAHTAAGWHITSPGPVSEAADICLMARRDRGSCGAPALLMRRIAWLRFRRSSEGCLGHKDRSRTSPTNPSLAGPQKCPGRGLNPRIFFQKCPGRGLNPRHLRCNNEGSYYKKFQKCPGRGLNPRHLRDNNEGSCYMYFRLIFGVMARAAASRAFAVAVCVDVTQF